jgi:hypothetical protein
VRGRRLFLSACNLQPSRVRLMRNANLGREWPAPPMRRTSHVELFFSTGRPSQLFRAIGMRVVASEKLELAAAAILPTAVEMPNLATGQLRRKWVGSRCCASRSEPADYETSDILKYSFLDRRVGLHVNISKTCSSPACLGFSYIKPASSPVETRTFHPPAGQ